MLVDPPLPDDLLCPYQVLGLDLMQLHMLPVQDIGGSITMEDTVVVGTSGKR